MEERSPSFKRNFQKLGGVTPRKLLLFFNDQFLRDVNPIFSGFHIVLYIPNLVSCSINYQISQSNYFTTRLILNTFIASKPNILGRNQETGVHLHVQTLPKQFWDHGILWIWVGNIASHWWVVKFILNELYKNDLINVTID